MPIDREATLKKAEKLLRQGKLDGAIAEYVRLVEENPKDWNSINALGDLYARAGEPANAVEQYTRVADYLHDEGFLPKAAALYKKILKIRADDEHTLMRLAEIAAGAGVLVDAKHYFRQIAERRRQKGDAAGAAQIVVRLGEIDPSDPEAKIVAARAAQSLKEIPRACALLTEAADVYEKQKRVADALAALAEAVALDPDDAERRARLLKGLIAQGQIAKARSVARTSGEFQEIAAVLERDGHKAEALEVLTEAAQLDPGNHELRGRLARECVEAGRLDIARMFLTAETVGDDPILLMALARLELQAGRVDEGKAALNRLLAVAPDRRNELVFVACEMADHGQSAAAFACVDLVADAALLEEDWGGAAAALHEFVTRVPNQIPALMKLVEICVDGGLESTMYMAQAQLADAYLAAGLGAEARVIAEDLVAREPWVRANIERFRRALILLGHEHPDALIAERLSGESPFLSTIDLPEESSAPEPPAAPTPAAQAPPSPPVPPAPEPPALTLDLPEVDLSDALSGLDGIANGAPPASAPPLDDVFGQMRARADRESQLQNAQAQFAAGIDHSNHGRVDQAIASFEASARVPLMRFQAGTRLGRLHVARGDLAAGVEWLERASQAPAPTPDDGYAVLFELADALERLGENARALAVLLELSADAGAYRDVAGRIERLSKVQTGG